MPNLGNDGSIFLYCLCASNTGSGETARVQDSLRLRCSISDKYTDVNKKRLTYSLLVDVGQGWKKTLI